MDYSSAQFLGILGTTVLILLISLFVAKALYWGPPIPFDPDNLSCNYSYAADRGPATWKNDFPDSRGDRQSPINIDSNCAIVLSAETLPPLQFSPEHHITRHDLILQNDGHCVNIYATWEYGSIAKICGGCLEEDYIFFNLSLRWGPNDDEGSEHTVDSQMYAMELQATYTKSTESTKCFCDMKQSAEENSLLIISYFYQVVSVDNPLLQPIINGLKLIKCPSDSVDPMEPLALSSLMPPFHSKYYTYNGSLTYPPCTEGVMWMIQPKPLGISARQVCEFRKLSAKCGRLERNTRPVQNVNSRELRFYD